MLGLNRQLHRFSPAIAKFGRFSNTLRESASNLGNEKIVRSKYECPELKSDLMKKSFPRFILDKIAGFNPDAHAIVNGSIATERIHTFKTLHDTIYQLAEMYLKLNFTNGQCVAVITPNHTDYFVPILAAGLVGCHSTTVNPQYTEKEIAYQLDMTSTSIAFVHSSVLERVTKAVELASLKVKLFTIDSNPSGIRGAVCTLEELVSQSPGISRIDFDSFPGSSKSFDNNATYTIPFSSGTTGNPKGVMVTHRNSIANILQLLAVDNNFTQDARLIPLPCFHAFGILSFMTNHYIGAKTVLMSGTFDLVRFLDLLQEHKVARCGLVPPIILALAKHPIVSKYDLSSLKTIGSGAAPLGAEIQKLAATRLKCVVKQGWGMTEVSAVGSLFPDELAQTLPQNAPSFGSVGVLVPESEAKIVDPATGVILDPKQEGEICIRGPHVMKGYYRNPTATAATIDAEGWLHTGDIGHFDDDGYMYITDRCKELIKYKGFQVAPAELEALINTLEGVKDCVVIPVDDEDAGEIPRAYVVKQENAQGVSLTEKGVVDFVAANVSSHKRLRGGVRFAEVIPRSPSGKLLRRVQKETDRAAQNAKQVAK